MCTYILAIIAGHGRDIQVQGFEVSSGCKVPFGHKKLILLQAFVLSPFSIQIYYVSIKLLFRNLFSY